MRLAARFGMMDQPGGLPHKIHAVATPRAGGMVILVTILFVTVLTGVWQDPPVRAILLGGAIIFGLGAWDDARGMSAITKVIGQVLAALVLMSSGVAVQMLHSPVADSTLTVFWVVGVTNAYNLVDSMDGEAIGLAGLAAAFLMLATMSTGQEGSVVLSAILVGTCAGLLYYNVTPARLFLGDSGSQLLGFALAALGIVFTPSRTVPQLSSWFVPILIMIVPILDTTMVTASRLRRRVPFYKGNRDHTYHRLVAIGVPPLRAVLTIHLASVLAGCLAFVAIGLAPMWANSIFFAVVGAGLAAAFWLSRAKLE
jgi:UDP-GlcNAc:undecaprenyl-phosphate GlcNAc-1-phosphate transferase